MGTKINYNRKRNEEETDRREILWTYMNLSLIHISEPTRP